MAMSGNPQLDYPIATLPGREKPRFAAMGCQQQVESHLFDTLDSVDSRRFLVLDEERQLVFGFFMLNWYRDNRCNEVRDYGRVCRPEGQQPTGLRVGGDPERRGRQGARRRGGLQLRALSGAEWLGRHRGLQPRLPHGRARRVPGCAGRA